MKKSDNAITINARLLEGAKLDKLADGRLMIKSGKTTKAPGGYSPPGRVVCAVEPGLFVRFNTGTYDHAFGVVTKRVKDRVTGKVTGGSEHIIGRLSDFHVETVGGRRKYDLDRVLETCRAWYTGGKPGSKSATGATGITLEECFDLWIKKGKRGKKNQPRKESHVAQVRRVLDVFAHDWLSRPISSITDHEIESRASDISDGEHLSPVSGKLVGSYAEARRFLLSLSSIHNASKRSHKSFNEFDAMLSEYPQDDGKQRAFTHDEIAAIFNLDRTLCRQKNGDKNPGAFDPTLWLRFLSIRFQVLSGYRVSEVIAIRDRDIVRDDATCPHIVSGDDADWLRRKSERTHWLPLTPALVAILDEAIATRDECESMAGSDVVFCNSTGGRYASGPQAFNRARKFLVDLDLIKPEKVPGNGSRLIVSHDARRTFETYGEHDAGIDLETLGAFLDHSDSKLAKQVYSLPSEEQRLSKLATLTTSLEKIGDVIFDIARDNA